MTNKKKILLSVAIVILLIRSVLLFVKPHGMNIVRPGSAQYFSTDVSSDFIFKKLPDSIMAKNYHESRTALIQSIETKFNSHGQSSLTVFILFLNFLFLLGVFVCGLAALFFLVGALFIFNTLTKAEKKEALIKGTIALLLFINFNCLNAVYIDNATNYDVKVNWGFQQINVPKMTYVSIASFIGMKNVKVTLLENNELVVDAKVLVTNKGLPFKEALVFNVLGANSYFTRTKNYEKR